MSNDNVTTICYGKKKVWKREHAIQFFRDAARCCDGSERDRYLNILWKLDDGEDVADDND